MITGVSERVKRGGSIMTMKETAIRRVVAQFGHPSGFWGPAVGWIMASRSSNRRRNVWAVSLLNVERHDRVLEIGFGPGIAIQEISRIAVEGYVCGLDHSEQMLHQASRRNAAAIRAGRVDLRLGSVECLPVFDAPFDKVLTVNTLMFWTRPARVLEQLRRLLRAGGRIAVAHQPRGPGASDATASATGEEIAAALGRAGFSDMRIETMKLKPAAVCAIGVNPPDGGM
jgi:ubiquinone/menaquinone biosynthesis C-methylase UbiE